MGLFTGTVTVKNSTEIWIQYTFSRALPSGEDGKLAPGESRTHEMNFVPVTLTVDPWKGEDTSGWGDFFIEFNKALASGVESYDRQRGGPVGENIGKALESFASAIPSYQRIKSEQERREYVAAHTVMYGAGKQPFIVSQISLNHVSKAGILPTDDTTFQVTSGWSPSTPNRAMGFIHPL